MIVLPVVMAEAKESSENFFIELYELNLRTGTYYIAACDENIEFNGKTYVAIPFQREAVTRSMDNIVDSCSITLGDVNYELLRYVLNGYDFRGSTATVFRIMYPDSLEDPTIAEWIFTGYIDSPSFAGGVFSCKLESRFPSIECPNRSYQLACNSEFGDEECQYVPGRKTTNILEANGKTVTVDGDYEDGYWNNGVITIGGESRVIEKNEQNVLTLNVNFMQDNIVSKAADLVQGCNKTHDRCKYYNNAIHYGGFPAIPFESVYR